MMYLTKWNPFREMERNFLGSAFDFGGSDFWHPVVDLYEKDNNIVIKAELPGLQQDDIEVKVEQNHLIIKGERKKEEEHKDKKFYRSERNYGMFHRVFGLTDSVDAEKISAKYRDGVLEIVLPKANKAKPKKIKIAA